MSTLVALAGVSRSGKGTSAAVFAELARDADYTVRPITYADQVDRDLRKKIMVNVLGETNPGACHCGNLRGWISLRSLHPDEHDAVLLGIRQ